MVASNDPLVGRTLGRYRIVYSLKKGGMGVVYLARHTLLGKPFALKLLRMEAADDQSMVGRFKREAQALSRLSHPNTVMVTDFGATEDGLLFLVMEFLQGITCADVITSEGALPPERVIYLAIQICDALAEAHSLQICHRDIKPSNILITRVGDTYDFVKLIDFGLAKQSLEGDEAEVTRAGLLIGTPHYMAPEQIKGANVDARGDIYALGITLYRLLTGRHPFDHTDMAALFHKHLSEAAKPPSDVLGEGSVVDLDLDAVILKCLEKAPEDRFQTARELRDALSACASAGTWDQDAARLSFEHVRDATIELDLDDLLAGGADDEAEALESSGSGLSGLSSSGVSGRLTPGGTPASSPSFPHGEMVGSGHPSGQHLQRRPIQWRTVALATLAAGLVAFVGGLAAVMVRDTAMPVAVVSSTPTSAAVVPSRSDGDQKSVATPAAPKQAEASVPATPTSAAAPSSNDEGKPAIPPTAAALAGAKAPSADVSSPPAQPPAPAAEIKLRISSNPSQAQVFENDEKLGKTPLDLKRPRAQGELSLSFRRAGYRTATRNIDLSSVPAEKAEQSLVVNLRRIPPKTRRKKVTPKTTASSKAPKPWDSPASPARPSGGGAGSGGTSFQPVD